MSPAHTVTGAFAAVLARAWSAIRHRHADVPECMIAFGSGTVLTSRSRLGHWAAQRWTMLEDQRMVGEMFLAGEALREGAPFVMMVLLHEAAHALATARDIKDTSRGGRYHNARFQALAIELGLAVEKHEVFGWTDTSLTPATEREYADTIIELDAAIRAHRIDDPKPERKPRKPKRQEDDDEGAAGSDDEGDEPRPELVEHVCACGAGRAWVDAVNPARLYCAACGGPCERSAA